MLLNDLLFSTLPSSRLYEFNLNWFLNRFHELEKEWDTTKAAWLALKEYVETFFDELDVQEEINNKLDKMYNNGELETLLEPYIVPSVENWLDNNITPSMGVTDKTLLIDGANADSKVTGLHIQYSASDILNTLFFEVGTIAGFNDSVVNHPWGISSRVTSFPHGIYLSVDDFSDTRIDIFTSSETRIVSDITNFKYIYVPENTEFRVMIRSRSSTKWTTEYSFTDIFNDYRFISAHIDKSIPVKDIMPYVYKEKIFAESKNLINFRDTSFWIRGSYETGNETRSIHSDYLPISDFTSDKVYYSGLGYTTFISFFVYFFDSNKNLLSQETVTGLNGTTKYGSFNIPIGTAYYMLQLKKQSGLFNLDDLVNTQCYLYVGNEKITVYNDIENKYYLPDYKRLFETTKNVDTLFSMANRYVNNNGEISTNSIYECTPFIKVAEGDAYMFDLCMRTTASYMVAFYTDKDLTTFDSTHSIVGQDILHPVRGFWVAPSDGYVRFSNSDEYTTGYFKKLTGTHLNQYNGIETEIPSYWCTEVDRFVNDVNDAKLNMNGGISLYWITDTHYLRAQHKSPLLLNYCMQKTKDKILLHGGDFIATNRGLNKNLAYDEFNLFFNNVNNSTTILNTFGNHDTNSVGNVNTDGWLSTTEQYNACYRHMESNGVDTNGDTACYSYVFDSQKIRMVIARYYYGEFIVSDLLERITAECDKAVANGEKIVFVTHAYWNEWNEATNQYNVDDGANAILRHLLYLKDNDYNIILWMVGHTHADYSEILSHPDYTSKIRCVATQCDCVDRSIYHGSATMTKNTDTEQAFDYVIIEPNSNKVTYIRCGAIIDGHDKIRTYTLV